MAHTSPLITTQYTTMDSFPSPYEKAIHSTHTCLEHFIVSTSSFLRTMQASKKSITADPAIRIDHVNPAGVYFFTHALATYRHIHVMYLGNLQAEALARVSSTAYLNTQVSRPGLSPIRVPSARRSGRGVAHGPK